MSNQKLVNSLSSKCQSIEKFDLETIHEIALKITSEELNFTFEKASLNPNVSVQSKKANCVGYSALYGSAVRFIIVKQNLENSFEVKHFRGEISFLGINLHQFTESPAFKDHDFNSIQNLETGEIIFSDPSLHDYFLIEEVKAEK